MVQKTWLMTVCLMLALQGCTSIRDVRKDAMKGETAAIERATGFTSAPSIVKIPVPRDAFFVAEPAQIPMEKEVNVSFLDSDLGTILNKISCSYGLNIVFNSNSMLPQPGQQAQITSPVAIQAGQAGMTAAASPAQDEAPVRKITLNYKGSIRGLFKVLSGLTGYFFTYQDGAVVVKQTDTFSVLLPSYLNSIRSLDEKKSEKDLEKADFLREVEDSLMRLGARGIGYDTLSSTMTFRANEPAFRRVKGYLQDIKDNASLVTMRVIILNVRLTSDENAGIDWSRFNMGWKAQMQEPPFGNITNSSSGSSSSGNSPGSDSLLASAAQSYIEGLGAISNGTGANFLTQTSKFTLSTLLNFISDYGKSDIIQNVFVQTLSGREGRIDVLTETPYVSSVSVAALSSNAAATQSAANTEKAKSGVQLRLQPVYSKAAQTLSLRLFVGVFGVTRFVDLSAGALGSFTQPETTMKTLDTFIRMKPDQVAVLGGLIYDANSGGTRGLPGDSYLTKSVNKKTQKEELVIVLKPTVFEFEAM